MDLKASNIKPATTHTTDHMEWVGLVLLMGGGLIKLRFENEHAVNIAKTTIYPKTKLVLGYFAGQKVSDF